MNIRFAVPALALLACSSASMEDTSTTQEPFAEQVPHVLSMQGESRPGGGSSGSNLIDHGGKILPASNTYAIFWGDPAAFPSDAKVGLDAMFNGLTGTSYLNILTQYMRTDGGAPVSSFHTNWTDLSSPPTHNPAVSTIVGEACNMINQNGAVADPTGLYLVYASNFLRVNWCGWHSHGVCNGVDIQVSYILNLTGVAGCDPGNLYNCNTYSQGTRALANVSSHEFMETASDSDITAWYDSSGSEIGDKCAWTFSSCVNLTTNKFQLQREWSNNISGCAQQ